MTNGFFKPSRTAHFEHTVAGLLTKRQELMQEMAELRERMAVAANAVDALDMVLETFGFEENLEGRSPRAARIILFYRNELRQFLLAQLTKANEPLSSRQLACFVCETEGKSSGDRRLLSEVTRRVGCALRKMRATKQVNGHRGPDGSAVWYLPDRGWKGPKVEPRFANLKLKFEE